MSDENLKTYLRSRDNFKKLFGNLNIIWRHIYAICMPSDFSSGTKNSLKIKASSFYETLMSE